MKSASPRNLESFSRRMVEIMPLMFREFAKREDNALTRGKISFPQMVVLDYASRRPRVTMSEVAKVLSVKMSSGTVLVDRMVRDKLLSRFRDGKDRRQVWVRITPKGKRVIVSIMNQKRRSVKAIFSVLSGPERRAYLGLLEKAYSGIRAHSS